MTINPTEISDIIKDKIKNLDIKTQSHNEGTVVSLTDGIARIYGITDALQGEMLEFPNNIYGLALNLERDSVGAVILGDYKSISEGDIVKCTGNILEVPVGDERNVLAGTHAYYFTLSMDPATIPKTEK